MQGPINLGPVMSAHAKFKRANADAISREAEGMAKFGVGYVAQHPTFHPRTGGLQKATEGRVIRSRTRTIIRLSNKKKYANPIEYGSPKHMIAAKRAKALAFMWHGHLVFRRYVIHPGNKPYKFLYRATMATGRVFETSMRARMDRIARGF